jgi:hypothetical protein
MFFILKVWAKAPECYFEGVAHLLVQRQILKITALVINSVPHSLDLIFQPDHTTSFNLI